MKSLLIVLLTVLSIGSVSAQVKCERSLSGGMCCWDVRTDGPFRPLGC
jgi:hypothetical protein